MEDRLTIAIPVYNRSTYFREALESALNQTRPTKVLVVDNASTQFDFEAVVKGYRSNRVRYVRNETNLGMVGNWNRCIELCETEYLTIVHDDDKLMPEYVSKIAEAMANHPAIVFCRHGFIDGKGQETGEVLLEDFRQFRAIRNWCDFNPFSTSIAFRLDVCRRIGGFKPGIRFTPDFDLWFRLAIEGGFDLIEDLLSWYRVYESGDRCTSVLEKRYDVAPCRNVQVRRNIHLYKKHFPGDEPPKPKPWFVSFRDLIRYWGRLSKRRRTYVLAVYVNSCSPSVFGKMARRVMRAFGRPVCSIAATVVKFGGPETPA